MSSSDSSSVLLTLSPSAMHFISLIAPEAFSGSSATASTTSTPASSPSSISSSSSSSSLLSSASSSLQSSFSCFLSRFTVLHRRRFLTLDDYILLTKLFHSISESKRIPVANFPRSADSDSDSDSDSRSSGSSKPSASASVPVPMFSSPFSELFSAEEVNERLERAKRDRLTILKTRYCHELGQPAFQGDTKFMDIQENKEAITEQVNRDNNDKKSKTEDQSGIAKRSPLFRGYLYEFLEGAAIYEESREDDAAASSDAAPKSRKTPEFERFLQEMRVKLERREYAELVADLPGNREMVEKTMSDLGVATSFNEDSKAGAGLGLGKAGFGKEIASAQRDLTLGMNILSLMATGFVVFYYIGSQMWPHNPIYPIFSGLLGLMAALFLEIILFLVKEKKREMFEKKMKSQEMKDPGSIVGVSREFELKAKGLKPAAGTRLAGDANGSGARSAKQLLMEERMKKYEEFVKSKEWEKENEEETNAIVASAEKPQSDLDVSRGGENEDRDGESDIAQAKSRAGKGGSGSTPNKKNNKNKNKSKSPSHTKAE